MAIHPPICARTVSPGPGVKGSPELFAGVEAHRSVAARVHPAPFGEEKSQPCHIEAIPSAGTARPHLRRLWSNGDTSGNMEGCSEPDRLYESIGARFGAIRQPDHQLHTRIVGALGDACPVLNVGAGTGHPRPL